MSTAPTPYVGMRPYEREERERFFGRENDARRLVDKIFATPITLFCALSGVGKSSVLRALVVPELESEACHVVYFESWSGTEPLCELTGAVAASAGVSVAGDALVEAVEKAIEATNKTVVLVLDQFEELLVRHGLELAPMSKALGTLCRRQDIDVHVVLSLREEFLAALEPFRDDVPMLFRATFRLQHLDETRAREAIEQPAALPGFDKHYEPALVDALIADLNAYAPGHGHTVTAADMVELPFLQLVCSELWTAAADRELGDLTLSMYQELGRLDGIMKRYVRRVMADLSDAERTEVAHILDFLAPESQLKSTYSVAELHRHCKVPEDRIQRYLDLLGRHRIVRTRPVGAIKLYELYHDAFIPMLRPWSEGHLEQEERRHEEQEHRREDEARQRKRRRRALIAACFAALFIASILSTIQYLHDRDYRQNVTDKLDKLPGKTPDKQERTLDEVTTYLLQHRDDDGDFAEIRRLLKENESYLPDSYDTDEMLSYLLPAASPGESWPITIRLSPDRRINEDRLRLYWRLYATSSVTQWGIPVPVRVRIQRDARLPSPLIEIAVQIDADPNVPRYRIDAHENALLIGDDLPEHLEWFMDALKENNDVERDDELGGWLVPRWSYPVWKVSEYDARPAEARLAKAILKHLLDDDMAPMLTRGTVDYLLGRLGAGGYQATVAAACAARGSMLRDDLLAIYHKGTPFHDLPRILETLAERPVRPPKLPGSSSEMPEPSSDEVARAVHDRVQDLDVSLPDMLPDASAVAQCPGLADQEQAKRRQLDLAYQDIESWLQLAHSPIYVTMGKNVIKEVVRDGTFDATLKEEVSTVRSRVFRKWGVLLPGVSFQLGADVEIKSNAARIDVLSRRGKDGILLDLEPGKAAQQIASRLYEIAKQHRSHWPNLEWVVELHAGLPQALQTWLDTRYSLAGQAVLLRAVLDQGPSIRHLDWLLASLLFWAQVDDAHSTRDMAARLSQTQKARTEAPEPVAAPGVYEVEAQLGKGIDALENGAMEQAESEFKRALDMNRSAAVKAFPRLYAEHFPTWQLARIMNACEPPDPKNFTAPATDSVHAHLAEDIADLVDLRSSELAPAILRRLRICRVWNLVPLPRPSERRKLLASAVEAYAPVADQMPPEEAYWLAYLATAFLDEFPRDHERLKDIETLATSAISRTTDADWQVAVFVTLSTLCRRPGPRRWCWGMLEKLDNAQNRSAWIPLLIAEWVYLNRYRDTEDIQLALHSLQRAESLREHEGNQPPAENIENTRLYARLLQLVSGGDINQRSSIEARLLALRENEQWRDFASEWLFTLYQALGEQANAAKAVDWDKPENQNIESLSLHFMAMLWGSGGDLAPALELARKGTEKFGDNETTLFIAALGHILARKGEWEFFGQRFLYTEHPYAPYIAMMLYAALSEQKSREDAHHFLEMQWRRIDRNTWDERLQGGDPDVWREMLIGYFLDKVKPDELFPVIEDPGRYASSGFRQLPLPRSTLLCELHFYDGLLQQARGNHTAAKARLEQVVNPEPSMLMEYRRNYEYHMARHLLAVMARDT